MFGLFKKQKPKKYLSDYDECSAHLSYKDWSNALRYYKEHTEHVNELVDSPYKASHSPYWEDKHQPELWFGSNWRWFFGIEK